MADAKEGARRGRAAAGALGFVLGLALSAAGFRALLARVPGARVEASVERQQEKYAHWERHHDDYDVVFVGSSRVYRELVPRVFDEAMERRGRPVRSFNFGLPGMELLETLHTVDWLLSFEPTRLRWMVIELQELDAEQREENRFTRRSLAWHTPRLAALAARSRLEADGPLVARLDGAGAHALQALGHAVSLGTGVPLCASLLGYGAPLEFAPEYDGWRPLEAEAEEQHGQRRERLATERARLDQRIEALRAERESAPPTVATRSSLERLVARVRSHGVEPVFLVPAPTTEAHAEHRGALEAGVLPNLFAYNDPDRFPTLYDPERFFDVAHLGARASMELTGRFASDLADWLDGDSGR